MFKEFQLLTENDSYVLYHISSNKIIKLNKFSYNIVNQLMNDNSIEEISKEFEIDLEKLNHFVENIMDSVPCNDSTCEDRDTKYIDRITLHVSNDCNLRCSYCYGDGGSYNQKKELMSEETAEQVVEFLADQFDEINNIVFFGGEPLLNVPVINKICNSLKKKKDIVKVNNFNIITNGTIVNQEILDLINKHIASVVVSIDGPEEANDLHRKFSNGKGSFQKIKRFIETVTTETNSKIQYEATYTDEHWKMGFSKTDINEYLMETFAITGGVLDEMKLDSIEEREYKGTTLEEMEELLLHFDSYIEIDANLFEIIRRIAKGESRSMCPIGSDTVAISVNGEIIPCHVLLDSPNYSLGNINSRNIFNDRAFYNGKYNYLKVIDKNSEDCRTCWARNLCGGCSLIWFYDFNKKVFLNKPNMKMCDNNKLYFKYVIITLAKLRSDEKLYNNLLEKLQEAAKTPCLN